MYTFYGYMHINIYILSLAMDVSKPSRNFSECQDFMETLQANSAELPALVQMRTFHSWCVHFDVLHVAYRGFGPDYIASVLQLLFKGNCEMARGHQLAKGWAKAQGVDLACEEFNISMESSFPTLQAKGMDIKLLTLWLVTWQLSFQYTSS